MISHFNRLSDTLSFEKLIHGLHLKSKLFYRLRLQPEQLSTDQSQPVAKLKNHVKNGSGGKKDGKFMSEFKRVNFT